jgi:hypothetical protein
MRQDKVEFLRNSPNIYGLFLSPLLGLDVPSYASRPKIDDSRLNLTIPFGGVSNFAFETPPDFLFCVSALERAEELCDLHDQ